MYYPGNWGAWVSDGLAHANLVCAMWLVALSWRSTLTANRAGHGPDSPLRRSVYLCCSGAVLNAVLVVIHYRVWQSQMGMP